MQSDAQKRHGAGGVRVSTQAFVFSPEDIASPMLGFASPVILNGLGQSLRPRLRFVEAGDKMSGDVRAFSRQNLPCIGLVFRALRRNRWRLWLAQVLGSSPQESACFWKIAGLGIGGHGSEFALIEPSVARVGFRKRGGAEPNCFWAKASSVGWLPRI